MRTPLLQLASLLVALGGCESALGPFAAANVVSLTTTGRAVPDLAVSAWTGRDCSVAHLDRGESRYCRPDPLPPAPAVYCTRSLGSVDCWSSLPPGSPPPRPVADAPPSPPRAPTERWPLNLF